MYFQERRYSEFDFETQKLLNASILIRENAYVPYSQFPVGAAVLSSSSNTIYTGCNVENASFCLTTCAERTAVAKAVSDGSKKFKYVAVCAVGPNNSFVSPCGSCRQILNEFKIENDDMIIYLVKPNRDTVKVCSLADLLPLSFNGF